MTTHSSRSARQRPGSSGESTAATISQAGRVTHIRAVRPTTAGASTTRRSAPAQPPVTAGPGSPGRRRTSRRCVAATVEKSRWPRSVSSRAEVPRAGRTCASTWSGSSATSRVNRWRRAISKDTLATSHGRRGTRQRPVDPAHLQHEDPVRAELHGAGERDRVHDAPVEVVLATDARGRQQPRHGRARDDGVDERAGVEPVLGGPLDAGRADLEPDREVLDEGVAELLARAAAAAAWRSRCGCRSTPPGAPCAAAGRRRPGGCWRPRRARAR